MATQPSTGQDTVQEEPARLVPRSDVRFVHRCGHLYICSSSGTLRVPQRALQPPADDGTTRVESLPEAVVAGLAARALVAPPGTAPGHPLYGTGGRPDGRRAAVQRVAVAGRGPLPERLTEELHRAGLHVVRAGIPDQASADVLVVPLHADEPTLRQWTEHALAARLPVLAYLSTPARLLYATLEPPHSACPVCLVLRLRANHRWQAIADLPLDVLFGAVDDARWPSTAVAAATLAHQVLMRSAGRPRGTPAELLEFGHASSTTTRHPVLHTPLCPACAAHTVLPAQTHDPAGAASGAAHWARMRQAVDPLTGLVGELRVRDEQRSTGTSTTCVRTAGHPTTTWFSPVQADCRGGSAKRDAVLARVCAVGESMERYAAGVYDPDRLVRSTLRALGDAAVDPRSLSLGSPREYATVRHIAPFHPDLEIDWVPGRSLTTGAVRYLPACAVYVPYRFPRPEERLTDPLSTGLAAGDSVAHAVFGGLMEVVERDAVAVFWENRLALPTVDLTGLPAGEVKELVDRLVAVGVQVTCKDLTTDLGIPVISVRYVEGTPERPRFAHAPRADLDPLQALLGALEEADLARTGLESWLDGADPPPVDQARLREQEFYTYYCAPGRLSLVPFWDDGPLVPAPAPRAAPATWQAAVDEAVERLAVRGHEPIVVDLTPIDVAECGVRVVRTVVPGLCPISLRRDFRRRGGRRLFEAPVLMGVRETPLDEAELNPYPLPLG